jgi:hypothetical protein
MALALNGVNINPNTSDVSIDGVVKESVDYNGTRVWTRVRDRIIVERADTNYGQPAHLLTDGAWAWGSVIGGSGWDITAGGRVQYALPNRVTFTGFRYLKFQIINFTGNPTYSNYSVGFRTDNPGYWVHAGTVNVTYKTSATPATTHTFDLTQSGATNGYIQLQAVTTGVGTLVQVCAYKIWLTNTP